MKTNKKSIWKCLNWLEVITMNLKLVSVSLKPKPVTSLFMTSTVLPRIVIGCQVCVYVFSHVWLFETPWTVCSLPGSSVHGILQATILEWVPISSHQHPRTVLAVRGKMRKKMHFLLVISACVCLRVCVYSLVTYFTAIKSDSDGSIEAVLDGAGLSQRKPFLPGGKSWIDR